MEIKDSAEKRNINFNLTVDEAWQIFLKQEKQCSLTGLELNFDSRGYRGSASLDRIDSFKGYTTDNVQWIFCPINLMKGVHNVKYFIYLCKLVAENHDLNQIISGSQILL